MSATASLDNALQQLQLIFPTLALPSPLRHPASLADSLTVPPSQRSVSARHCLSPTLPTTSAVSPPCASSSTSRSTSISALYSSITVRTIASSKKKSASMNKPPLVYSLRRIPTSHTVNSPREIWSMMSGDGRKRRMTLTSSTFFSLIDIFYWLAKLPKECTLFE